MGFVDEQIKNYRNRNKIGTEVFNKNSNNNVIETKISTKSIFNRNTLDFKVRYCDKNQLKMILLNNNFLTNCNDLASIILKKMSEEDILNEIEITSPIFDKLENSPVSVLMKILFDNQIDFYTINKFDLINKIAENINYNKIKENLNNIQEVNAIKVNTNELIKQIQKNHLISNSLKNLLIFEINYNEHSDTTNEISKFLFYISNINIISKKSTPENKQSVETNISDKPKFVKKYEIVSNKNINNDLSIENPFIDTSNSLNKIDITTKDSLSDNPFIESHENNSFKNTNEKSDDIFWDFKFSNADKKDTRGLYSHQKEIIKREIKNDASAQLNKILRNISKLKLTDENKNLISQDIDEINAFINKHELNYQEIKSKYKEVERSFKDFSNKVTHAKVNFIKRKSNKVFEDLVIKKRKFRNEHYKFYLILSEKDVIKTIKKLIDSDHNFSKKLEEIIDYYIKKYNSIPRNKYNDKVIKKLTGPDYINKKEMAIIKSYYKESIAEFELLNRLKNYFNNHKKTSYKRLNIESLVKKHNSKIMEQEYYKYKSFFDNFNGYELDEDQRIVVLSDESKSKIIAGAGTGKTFTLLAKLKYLIDYRNFSQEKLLCISFSNAAVNDLKKKISETVGKDHDIDIFTFHKLGMEILKLNNEDYIPTKNFLRQSIEEYFEKHIIGDTKKIKRIMDFINLHNLNIKNDQNLLQPYSFGENLIELRTSKEYETLRDKVNQLTDYEFNVSHNESIDKVKTVNRQFVRSFEELIIANFLYVNNINYIYEDNFFKRKGIDINVDYIQYRPDFYLPKYDIYIEHYGVDKNLEAKHLDKENRDLYKKSIYWKRDVHKKYNSCLIETFSYENKQGVLLNNLERKLKENGVEFSPIDYSKIYERLIKNKKLDELEKLINIIEKFINLFKTNGYNIDDLGNDISNLQLNKTLNEIKSTNNRYKTRNVFLLEIIKDVYDFYSKQDGLDFDDLINNPIKVLNSGGKFKNYDYIFVDEYQDTSYSKFRLLKEIFKRTGAKFIVIGDDWQSIYSFNGCMIELFTNFENYFEYCKEFKIEKNYRNSSDLINISSNFILENESQLPKDLISNKLNSNAIKLTEYNSKKKFCLIFENMIKEISYNFPGKEILILGRYNDSFKDIIVPGLFEINNFKNYEKTLKEKGYLTIYYLEDLNLKIKFRTMHKSKGLEEENVIIIGLKNDKKDGFPSKYGNDSIMDYVLQKSDEKAYYAEERRLFYVALTRSRNNVYLLVDGNNPSEFITHLKNADNKNQIEYRNYKFTVGDFNRLNKFLSHKTKRNKVIDTKLKCQKCNHGIIKLHKKSNGKGYFKCSSCKFYFGPFNQSPIWINSLDYCNQDGCDGLTYVKKFDWGSMKICTYYKINGCDAGRK